MHHKVNKGDLKDYMFLVCPGPDAGKLMEMDEKGRLVLGALRDRLERTIVRRKIDIISLDPFVKAHAVGENVNDAIDKVAGVLTELAQKYNLSADAPHHVSKGQADPGNAQKGRGASAFVDAGRLVHTLMPMSSDEAKKFGISDEERHYFIRMDKGKVNTVPPARVAKWFKLIGVRLGNGNELYPNGDEVQTVEPWAPPEVWADLDADMQNAILDDIDAGLPDGNRYSDAANAGDREAWNVIVKHAPVKNESQGREIIKTWINGGVLRRDKYTNPQTRHKVIGLVVVAENRPR
jgi:AAA domain